MVIFCFLFSHYLHDHNYSKKQDYYLQPATELQYTDSPE